MFGQQELTAKRVSILEPRGGGVVIVNGTRAYRTSGAAWWPAAGRWFRRWEPPPSPGSWWTAWPCPPAGTSWTARTPAARWSRPSRAVAAWPSGRPGRRCCTWTRPSAAAWPTHSCSSTAPGSRVNPATEAGQRAISVRTEYKPESFLKHSETRLRSPRFFFFF